MLSIAFYIVAAIALIIAAALKYAKVMDKRRHDEIRERGMIAAANALMRKGEKTYSAHTGGRKAAERDWAR